MDLLDLGNGVFGIKSQFSPKLNACYKETPGMRWDPDLKVWKGYTDAITESFRKAQIAPFDLSPQRVVAVSHETLREYQVEGVGWLIDNARQGCILADVMGAGKTAQAIVAASFMGATEGVTGRQALIVCPSYVRGVWAKELARWWPGAKVFELWGIKPVEIPKDADVILCHYDIIHAHEEAIGTVYTTIFDEGHLLSNEKAQRSQVCKRLAHAAVNRVILTGTPMTNRPRDLWNVVDTVSPDRFGSFFAYARRYCGAVQVTVGAGTPSEKVVWDFSGSSNLDELKRRLKFFMLRRTHEDIRLELPPRTRQTVEIRVPTKHRIKIHGMLNATEMRRALDLSADGKLKDALEMNRQHVEDGHKVVVFCFRRNVADAVAAACGGLAIHGGFSQKQRDERIETCRNSKDPCLLAATIDVASVGIDLSFADVCVFVELTWEPTELAQAEARCYRPGLEKPLLVQYLIGLGTGDELIRDGVLSKLSKMDEAGLGADGGLSESLRNEAGDEAALRELLAGL